MLDVFQIKHSLNLNLPLRSNSPCLILVVNSNSAPTNYLTQTIKISNFSLHNSKPIAALTTQLGFLTRLQ